MKYSQLIEKCVELIDTYNENLMTPDSHAEQFLLQNNKCEDTQKVFLKQIFYGVQRYKNFLNASNNVIFEMFSTMTNRKNDSTLFHIFTYIICFRLDQLPFAEFKKMILSQEMVKMHVLFSFIFDFEMLQQKVLDKWAEHLQMPYLQEKILPKLVQRRVKCEELIFKVSQLATGKKVLDSQLGNSRQNIDDFAMSKGGKKTTVAKQFNLTKPKPKAIPEPIKIEVGFKANPAPKNKKTLKAIQEEGKKRRQEIKGTLEKFYEEKKSEEFNFQTSKRPVNLPKIKQEVEMKATKQLTKKITSRPIPTFKDVDVKLNVAAILREEKKLNQKIQEEELRMKNLEINMRDESEFENWKKQMKQKDQVEKVENQQKRKIEMQLAKEAAIKAYQENIEQKKVQVDQMRQMAAELKIQRQAMQEDALKQKKKVIEEVQQNRQNVALQRQKVLEKNKKIRDEQVEERKRILQKKKEQEKIQMQKRKQLIQQIRELQKNIKTRPKQEVQHVSIGLLEELTLEQLAQKLVNVKKQRKEQEQKRRQQNIKKKEQFKTVISQKTDTIMAHRQALAKQKQEERIRKKNQKQAEKIRLQEARKKSMMEYKKKQEQKLQEKKREKERMAKQLKETEQKRKFLMQGQAAQEANAFKNLEKGEEREILDRQNTKLIEEYKNKSIKQGQRKILADQNKKFVEKKFNKLYNEQEEFNNSMAQEVQQQDQAHKAMKYHQVRIYEQKHNQNMTKTNPFKTKIAQMSLTKAKSTAKTGKQK